VTTPADDVRELRRRLEEAEETLRAIRCGEVDALVVEGQGEERVYTLQGADQPYRVLIEAMQQGAVSLSGDGTVLYCNRCFAEMLQRPHEKVVGAAVTSFLPVSQRATFEAMLREGQSQKSQAELQLEAPDGTLLPAYVVLAPLPLADAVALCMVVTDLTEPKKHRDLQEADRRKDEFLAMLAHELRNPLAPIRNALHVVHIRGRERRRPMREAWEMIERQTECLVRLVDDLLDVSRISRGKINLQKQPVDVATIVARAVESSRPLIDARRHALQVTLPDEPLPVDADVTRMAQVLLNLLNNSAKYTADGGRIWLTVERSGGRVIITVRDNGMGIPADILPRMFDMFSQAERTLDRAEGGLGIGLTLVKRLTEMHGGTVEAFSEGHGHGSEFVVRLRLLSGTSPALAAGNQATRPRASPRKRILVVDDNRDSAESLAVLLRLVGHDVRTVHDGRQALVVAETYRPGLVLLDIGLPGIDGYEVARRLRAESWGEPMTLVALTGYGGEEDRRLAAAAGFDHHMVKPVDFEALHRLLAALEPTGE
jgi:PAS domain S-box-containing protein